jgi:outer membrane protein OmpA-like peptidoglycan-associated protein
VKELVTIIIILTFLLIQGCPLTPTRPDTDVSTGKPIVQDLTEVQAKINEVRAGQFGEFVTEIHYAGKELEKAQSIQDNLKAGKKGFSAAESYAAANKAVTHRNKAEAAFDKLFQLNIGDSNREDIAQRLSYLESLHVPKNLNIPVTSVYFNFGGHHLQSTEKEKIKDTVEFLRHYPVFAIKLVGYADTVGSEERNILLAERRNSAVIEELRKKGLPINTVVSVAFGEVNGPDETKNRENRRVEIVPYVHGDYVYPGKKKN